MADPAKTLEIQVHSTAVAVGKMRNEIEVYAKFGKDVRFNLPTDEGEFHGGESTAPPPLAYFCAGLTGCFMTQVRAFAKKLRVPLDGLKVEGSYHWRAHLQDNAPYVGAPVAFDLDIEIDSPAPVEDIVKLVQAAKEGCFIEQTMRTANSIGHRVTLRGETLEM